MMAEVNRQQEPLTTAGLAGGRSDFPDHPNLDAEASNTESRSDPSNQHGPTLVQSSTENADFSNEAMNESGKAGNSGEWDPSRPSQDYSSASPQIDFAAAAPLFSNADMGDLRSRWNDVQATFVDEPRSSVEQADKLVATVMQRLAEGFANERASLEKQWEKGDNVSTEDLRLALQRYRAFFGRLLNAA